MEPWISQALPFMQADIDEGVYVKFEGKIAKMLVKLDPKSHWKYMKEEHGKPVHMFRKSKASTQPQATD